MERSKHTRENRPSRKMGSCDVGERGIAGKSKESHLTAPGSVRYERLLPDLVFGSRESWSTLCSVKRQFGVLEQAKLSWCACQNRWARPLGPPCPPQTPVCHAGTDVPPFPCVTGHLSFVCQHIVRLQPGKRSRVALTLTYDAGKVS